MLDGMDVVNAWMEEEWSHCLPRSRRARWENLKPCLFALDAFGFRPHSKRAPDAVRSMISAWRVAGLSYHTIRARISMLRSFWKFQNRASPESILLGCFEALKRPKGLVQPPINVLTSAQQLKLLKWAEDFEALRWRRGQMYTFLSLGLNMALRPAEIIHLDWSEFVKHEGRWFVQLRNLSTRLVKNPRARAALEVRGSVLPLLETFFVWRDSGPLFPAASKSFSHRHILANCKTLLDAPWFNSYALRRSCITNWYNDGMPTHRITALARHLNDVTTERFYRAPAQFVDTNGLPIRF